LPSIRRYRRRSPRRPRLPADALDLADVPELPTAEDLDGRKAEFARALDPARPPTIAAATLPELVAVEDLAALLAMPPARLLRLRAPTPDGAKTYGKDPCPESMAGEPPADSGSHFPLPCPELAARDGQ
jgi:hypothetical protein